ncbi:MAG: PAS domain S-box protein [Candidatus Bathyarchaeia archaeon]
MEISSSLITYQGKQAVLSIARDLTERKKMQDAIKQERDMLGRITANIGAGLAIIDKDYKILWANDFLKYYLGNIEGKPCYATINTLGAPCPGCTAAKILSAEVAIDVHEFHSTDARGKPFWMQIVTTPFRDVEGKIVGVAELFIDITAQKQAQLRVKESEEAFRAIATSAKDALIVANQKGEVVYWNPAAERIFGYSQEEATGKDVLTLIVPSMYNSFQQTLMEQIKNSKLLQGKVVEFTARRKSGEEFPVELSAAFTPFKGELCILGIMRDISERKRIERQMQEAEKRYRTLFNEAPLGILLIDQNGRAVEFNEEAHRQLGYTREEFAKLTISDYEALETPEKTKARMKRIMETGRDRFETKHRTKTGEIRDVINNIQVIELGGKKLFHVITQDITEQKKIENALKMERDKLEAVTENIGAGLAIISRDYRILWANRLMKQINGECEGKICYSTFNKLTHVCPDCGVKKVFEKGAPIDVHEYTNVDKKGKRFWIELIVTPIKDETGAIVAALELAVNITERKILQNKLAEYSQKLEKLVEQRTRQLEQAQNKLIKAERLATIGELAAMIGHDIRNPLTAIKNAAYYLQKKGETCSAEQKEEMLSIINNAIHRANKIVNDLLEYSREIHLETKQYTPHQLLAEALKQVNIPNEIQLIDETYDAPLILVDAEKMVRVFVNLIKNAVEAMPKGGTLTITSRQKADSVEITFADTGMGIPEEVKAKLFNPLVTTKAQGMGFGLAICKRIIDAHQGEISVESTIGKGTTFTIKLPLKIKQKAENNEKRQSTLETSLPMAPTSGNH